MESELVIVRRVSGMLRAQVIKAQLESAGIPALLEYESAGPAIGITIDGLGEVRVMVPTRLERRARWILAEGPSPPKRALKASRRPPLRRGRPRDS